MPRCPGDNTLAGNLRSWQRAQSSLRNEAASPVPVTGEIKGTQSITSKHPILLNSSQECSLFHFDSALGTPTSRPGTSGMKDGGQLPEGGANRSLNATALALSRQLLSLI